MREEKITKSHDCKKLPSQKEQIYTPSPFPSLRRSSHCQKAFTLHAGRGGKNWAEEIFFFFPVFEGNNFLWRCVTM